MAQRVEVILVDDIDQSAADETVTFALDGVTYEIDLSKDNAGKLRDDFATWIGAGRRAGGRRATASAKSGRSARRADLGKIREWARAQGHTVSDRGRVSAEILAAYDAAH